MPNEVQRVENPFAAVAGRAQEGGAVAVQQARAVAEAIAEMQIARANPRDPVRATDMIIQDCTMPSLAEDATYEYARGGSDITGPSIRLAETIARRWGNIKMGVEELARREGYSEVRAYAKDMETGTIDEKLFQVKHWRDTKRGGHAVTDERDIYEVVANQGARRKRACILAVIPQDVVDAAVRQCDVTLKSKIEVTPDTIKAVLESFAKYGVHQEHIEKRIQRRLDALTPGMYLQLRKIYNSLKDEMSQPGDWFDLGQPIHGAGAAGGSQESSATDRLADELAAKRKGDTPPAPPAASTGGGAQPPAPKPAPAKPAFDEDTGEITNASVRAAIAAANDQADLTKIMPDIMKLAADDARKQTMDEWNKRVMALKQPEQAPKPAAPAIAKHHGTAKIKGEIRRKMNQARTKAELDAAFNERKQYAWDEPDAKELEARFLECSQDLDL